MPQWHGADDQLDVAHARTLQCLAKVEHMHAMS